jgi:hypothetical protein
MARIEGVDIDKAVGFVKLNPGVTLVEVESGKEGKSKTQERKVSFTLKIVETDTPNVVGSFVSADFSLQPQALWKLRQFRDACQVPSAGGDFFDTDDFVGRRLKIATSLKSFTDENGKTEERTQIDDFIAVPTT